MGLNSVNNNGYSAAVVRPTNSERQSCGTLCARICILIREVLCCKKRTTVHPLNLPSNEVPPLTQDRIVVPHDDPVAETGEASAHSYIEVASLETEKVEVRRKSDDPIENM